MSPYPDLAAPHGAWTYLDNAASTPVAPELLASLPDLCAATYANASATHRLGYRLRTLLDRQAERLCAAADIPAAEAQVIWTSGGTEANNLAIAGLPRQPDHAILISATEHASVARTAEALSAPLQRVEVQPDGQLDLAHLAACLSPATRLVSICLAQNETGVIQALAEVRRLLDKHAPRALLHTDAVQAFGKLPIPWREARLDMLSLSAHKFHGLGGSGALILRRGVQLRPLLHGGGQQGGLRSGSLDAPGILATAQAAELAATHAADTLPRVQALNTHTRERLAALTDRHGQALRLKLISPPAASPYILSVSLPGYQGAVLARALGERGIIIGTGSACAAESKTPSAVLTAMGRTADEAFGALRISFSRFTTRAEVDTALDALQQVIRDY